MTPEEKEKIVSSIIDAIDTLIDVKVTAAVSYANRDPNDSMAGCGDWKRESEATENLKAGLNRIIDSIAPGKKK